MTLNAESLMAVTGLWPGPSHPSANDELAALGIVASYRGRLKRWLRTPDDDSHEPRPFEVPEPPEEKVLQKRILATIEDGSEEHVRMLSGLPDHADADAYVAAIRAGRAYLDSKWPKIPVPGITADVFPLSTEELYDVWSLTRVLDNPDVLLDELEAESLTIPMVDAWRAVYPTLAGEVDKALDELVIDRLAGKRSLTWQQVDLYRMLRGIPLDAVIEVKKDAPKGQPAAPMAAKQGAPP